MSNIETVFLASLSQESTFRTGYSLAASLYHAPRACALVRGSAAHKGITIFLRGELGAGKTTFVQGLGLGLGVKAPIVSPTYALENRYGEELLHMDLFRIDAKEAKRLLEASEDFPGIRAVEWSERAEGEQLSSSEEPRAKHRDDELRSDFSIRAASQCSLEESSIIISFSDPSPTTRNISLTFADLPLPDLRTIEEWRNEVKLPDHIRKHCDAVGGFAKQCAEILLQRGTIARPHALEVAGKLHDLLRFVDFLNEEDRRIHPEWIALRKKYPFPHEEACAQFVKERGYPELGEIIRPHGLPTIDRPEAFQTIEQKLLFYADKRVMGDRVVSLEERFKDFVARYGKGVESEKAKQWRIKTEALEKELFGENVP